jgi:hypothetical protein
VHPLVGRLVPKGHFRQGAAAGIGTRYGSTEDQAVGTTDAHG